LLLKLHCDVITTVCRVVHFRLSSQTDFFASWIQWSRNLSFNELRNLGGSQFSTHGINGFLVSLNGARFLQDGRSSNHHVNTSFRNFLDVVNFDTSVNFQTAVNSGFIDHGTSFTGLVQSGRDEGLSSETGVDRHEKNDIKLVHDELGNIQAGSRVENKSSLASTVFDELERAVDVVGGFGVEGDVRGTGIDKVTDGGINGGNHQMNIDGGGNSVVTKGLAHHGPNGQVGDVVVIHDVEMDNISTGFQNIVDFFAQLGEVSRKDRRSDEVVLISPDIQGGGGTSGLLLQNPDSRRGVRYIFKEKSAAFISFRIDLHLR